MKSTQRLRVRSSLIQVDGIDMQRLVELACPRSSNTALAIVLDISDSCAPMRDEAVAFPRLVTHLPRDMPIWLYRLSTYAPSNKETHRVAHLQDGSLALSKWLEDSRTRAFMAARGSLLRPVLESIVNRKMLESVSQVTIVVLTDGELLDLCELSVPEGIDIVGLTTSSIESKCKHWRRVLPRFPIFDLRDPRLDSVFADLSSPFCGACELSWRHEETTLTVRVVDLTNARTWPVDRIPHAWNFIDQSLLLLLKTAMPTTRPPTIVCRSMKNDESVEIQLTPEIEPLDAATVAQASKLLTVGAAIHADVLLDVSAGDPQFECAHSQFLIARSLTISRGSWIDPNGVARVWNEGTAAQASIAEDGRYLFDALLCVANLEPADPADSRIIVFGLSKNRQPALEVGSDSSIDLGVPLALTTIRFDLREARWMLSQGDMLRELSPRGSQELLLSDAPGHETTLIALFSGSLR